MTDFEAFVTYDDGDVVVDAERLVGGLFNAGTIIEHTRTFTATITAPKTGMPLAAGIRRKSDGVLIQYADLSDFKMNLTVGDNLILQFRTQVVNNKVVNA